MSHAHELAFLFCPNLDSQRFWYVSLEIVGHIVITLYCVVFLFLSILMRVFLPFATSVVLSRYNAEVCFSSLRS